MTDLSRTNGRDGEYYKSLGSLEAMMEAHEKRLDGIDEKLDRLIEMSDKVKGGWITLSALVAVASVIGAFSSSIWEGVKRVIFG